jgi:glucose/arabinose dehydrogenase
VPLINPPRDTEMAKTAPVISTYTFEGPIIEPGNFLFYNGAMFPQWKGSALIGGMETMTLSRITFDGKGGAKPAERWNVGHRIRDVAVGPDGALWMVEDANPGGLFRVTPK